VRDSVKGLLILVLLVGLTILTSASELGRFFDGFEIIGAAVMLVFGLMLVGIIYLLVKK
jgi:hypothetical protein